MLDELWGGISDVLGDGLSSMLESILNATIFKLFYYLERALCWVLGVLMDLFEVFAGLETVTYNGSEDYLINVFFSNKAVNNIYWGMAIIGMALIFVFAGWAVIRKMFDIDGKQQQSMGQIIWGAVRSLILIAGLTLVVSVVLTATGVLMRQVDYIFNNAYHMDQPKERDFSDEEYAAMGRILATVGNYSMIPNSNNRYNLNLCFNDIRTDLLFLQKQGVFDYSYYTKDGDGNIVESWQSVLAQIAKSADLRQDVKIDVYNEGPAKSITAAMEYLQNTKNPLALEHVEATYTVSERTHLDRMIFLLGTFRAAHNSIYNEHPAFDDALRGPYFYEDGKSFHNYDQVIEDFDIGFKTDYILVWFAAIALIFNLVVIILNCVARIFNLMLLYVIAPPFIASAPLDNGGKFKQWTTAFVIQSLSVFGTVIAMQLLLIYLPIVASPELVLFKDKPLLNAIAQFMLVYGGSEAAKKAGSLVTGILADQAGMEAIRSGDMSGAASRAISKAADIGKSAVGVAAGVAGFALSPVTNLAKRPFKALGESWRKLGTGGAQARADKAVQEEIAKNKAIEKYRKDHPEEAKYLPGGGGGGGGGGGTGSQPNPQSVNANNPQPGTNNNQQNRQPPPIPKGKAGAGGRAAEAGDVRLTGNKKGEANRVADIRRRAGFDEGPGEGPGEYGPAAQPGAGQGNNDLPQARQRDEGREQPGPVNGGQNGPQQQNGDGNQQAQPDGQPAQNRPAAGPLPPNLNQNRNRRQGGGPGGQPRRNNRTGRDFNAPRTRYSLDTAPPPQQPPQKNNVPRQNMGPGHQQNQQQPIQANNGPRQNNAAQNQMNGQGPQLPDGFVPVGLDEQGYGPGMGPMPGDPNPHVMREADPQQPNGPQQPLPKNQHQPPQGNNRQ